MAPIRVPTIADTVKAIGCEPPDDAMGDTHTRAELVSHTVVRHTVCATWMIGDRFATAKLMPDTVSGAEPDSGAFAVWVDVNTGAS